MFAGAEIAPFVPGRLVAMAFLTGIPLIFVSVAYEFTRNPSFFQSSLELVSPIVRFIQAVLYGTQGPRLFSSFERIFKVELAMFAGIERYSQKLRFFQINLGAPPRFSPNGERDSPS